MKKLSVLLMATAALGLTAAVRRSPLRKLRIPVVKINQLLSCTNIRPRGSVS